MVEYPDQRDGAAAWHQALRLALWAGLVDEILPDMARFAKASFGFPGLAG